MEEGGANPQHTSEFLYTTVALTYTFRKWVFLAWDECKRGARKTTSTLRTEKQISKPNKRLFDDLKYCSRKTRKSCEIGHSRKSLTGMNINTHLYPLHPTPLPSPHHQSLKQIKTGFIIHAHWAQRKGIQMYRLLTDSNMDLVSKTIRGRDGTKDIFGEVLLT